MGNCSGKFSEQHITYTQNIKDKSEYPFKITNPRKTAVDNDLKQEKTYNLIDLNKKIPIVNSYVVDQIFPAELTEILLLLDFSYNGKNYHEYIKLCGDILAFKKGTNMNIIIYSQKDYEYLKKLKAYIAYLKDDTNEQKDKTSSSAEKNIKKLAKLINDASHEQRKIYIAASDKSNSREFSYPYFSEVEKFNG